MAVKKFDFNGALLIFILLMAFWLLLSASYHWQHLLIGTVLSLLLTFVWAEITLWEHPRPTYFTLGKLFYFLYYLVCLTVEVLKANISVTMIVLSPKLPISPGLVIMRNELKRDLSRVFYANSITLTPGTITVDLEGDLHIVHAFTRRSGVDAQDWYLYTMMKKLEADNRKEAETGGGNFF
jgi:multicomponent Na+:H+ antiporter subunit E